MTLCPPLQPGPRCAERVCVSSNSNGNCGCRFQSSQGQWGFPCNTPSLPQIAWNSLPRGPYPRVKSVGPEARLPGFASWFCHLTSWVNLGKLPAALGRSFSHLKYGDNNNTHLTSVIKTAINYLRKRRPPRLWWRFSELMTYITHLVLGTEAVFYAGMFILLCLCLNSEFPMSHNCVEYRSRFSQGSSQL